MRTVTIRLGGEIELMITGDNPVVAMGAFNRAFPGRLSGAQDRGVVYVHLASWLRHRGYEVELTVLRERGWIDYILTYLVIHWSRALYEERGLAAYRTEDEQQVT